MAIKQVRVQINGVWTTLTLNSLTKKYEAEIAAPNITSFNQSGGYYPITVEAEDLAGNKITKTSSDPTLGGKLRLVVKEVTAPVITVVSPSPDSQLSTNIVPLVFKLRDEANGSGIKLSTLRVQLDDQVLTNTSPGMVCTQVSGGYDVTYTPPSGLKDGHHVVHFSVQDNDGNMSAPRSTEFTVDTVPPVLTLTSPNQSTTYTNKNSLTVSGKTSDATSGPVKLTIKVGSVLHEDVPIGQGGEFSKVITLTEGSNSIEVKSTDRVGRYTKINRTVILDTVAPVVNAVTITPNPVNTGKSFIISIDAVDV